MTEKEAKETETKLIDLGFDGAEIVYPSKDHPAISVYPSCSQCETIVINGLACHETGCPNTRLEKETGL